MPVSPSARRGRRPDPALHARWRQRLARFDRSGLSAAAFCARESITLPSFYAWRRRLHASLVRPSIRNPGPPADAHFVPVRLFAPTPVEVHPPGGATLRLEPGCDLDFVRSLVAALGGPSC
jgi:transposase